MNRLILALLAAALCSCFKSDDNVAGTSSSTETGELAGLMVFQGGKGAPGATVALAPVSGSLSKPGAAGVSRADTVQTDARGRYSFRGLDSGRYDMSATLIKGQDTLVAFRFNIAFKKTLFVGVDTLVAPGKVEVKVLLGGNPLEGVTCYIPGTSFIAISGAGGKCVISGIEPGTYDVAFLHPVYLGDKIPGVNVLSGGLRTLQDVALRADPAKPPPAPQNLSAVFDKATGLVTLSWNPVIVSDLDGYVLYRDTAESVVPTRIPRSLIKDTIFRDDVFADSQDAGAHKLAYRIQSQDKDGNNSLFALFPIVNFARPNLPLSPGPASGSQGVGLAPTLTWGAVKGDKVTYSVYLSAHQGADSLVCDGLETAACRVGGLVSASTYYWKVTADADGAKVSGPEWSFSTVAPDTGTAPVITSQPASLTVMAGGVATFTVVAAGTAPLKYAWSWNDSEISSADQPSFTRTAVSPEDDGLAATVRVFNAAGSVTSRAAVLTVKAFTSQPDIALTVDAGPGVGAYGDIAVPADGLPVISYEDFSHHRLKVAKCGDAACSSANTVTTVATDPGKYAGAYSSIAVPADGRPVISYGAGTHGMTVVKCGNAACTSGNVVTPVVEVVSGWIGDHTAVAVPPDGLPVIAYADNDGRHVDVAKCGDAACSAGNVITEAAADEAGDISLAVAPGGFPVISYFYDFLQFDLKLIKCGNAACTSGNITVTLDSQGDVGRHSSVAVPADGKPVVSYYDKTRQDLKVVKCGSPNCLSGNTAVTLDSNGNVGEFTSIALAYDGLPIISYVDGGKGALKVVKCGDAACASGNRIFTLDATIKSINSASTSIAVPSDGLPVISYYDTGNSALKTVKCGKPDCSPP